jgi:uncharacterized protein (TIGR00297 family)
MANVWRRTVWACALSAGVGFAGHRRSALTPGGALGAMLVGTSVAGAGGWSWGIALVYFFVSSSLLSQLAPLRKRQVAADKFAKSARRDLRQALANGGVAAVLALLRRSRAGAPRAATLEAAFVGALAAATADTWATEVGTLSPRSPRLITTGRPVMPGTSGGVTPLGLTAAICGAASVGVVLAVARSLAPARVVKKPASGYSAAVRAAVAGGLAGSTMDSLLGALAQAIYWCPRCGTETERRVHRCGTATEYLRGARWLDNDGVNTLCTLVGALAGAASNQRR